MLTGIHVIVMGGDARQLEIIRRFAEMDATVTLIGFEELEHSYTGVMKAELSPEVFREANALVLPAVGTDDGGMVKSFFSSKELRLSDEHISQLPAHAKVYTGMAKNYLIHLCHKHQIGLVELFDRDDVAIYNSIPTAEGAIMIAIQNTDFTIHGSKCMVLGMGRTGFTLAHTLKGLGAEVKVGVRKPEQYARAWEMGFRPFFIDHLAREAADTDLLFNTIPTMIITAQVIANIPPHAVILDLATDPGADFRFAEKRGIKALSLPGLPGKVAPKTAGRILANSLCQLILEDMQKRRNMQ